MDALATVKRMVERAEDHATTMSKDRVLAMQYYHGEMTDLPADKNRSKVVSWDVRKQIKKALPSITRTILGADEVVEYQPIGPGDEEAAGQASDYVNFVVFPESGGHQAVADAIHDALLLRNGILKWEWDAKREVRFSSHSGLDDVAFAQLVADDAVEVVEHTETEVDGQVLHDLRIKRVTPRGRVKLSTVPRERLLVHPDAVSLQDSPLTGEKMPLTRSDLVQMGYDRDLVYSLPVSDEDDPEEYERTEGDSGKQEEARANEELDYYDLYVRIDMDDDGISELRHMVYAGGLSERNLLENEEVDEVQFADIAVMRQPHQWEGVSVYDDTRDVQRVNTTLLRQTLDNLYWQNNPQPIIQDGRIKSKDAVFNREFGLPITVTEGTDVRAAIGFSEAPFVAKESFAMLEYMDKEASDRTGITDASAGLPSDALQNVTAKASAMLEQQGIGQTEMMVRTVADGLAHVFRGLLRLIVRHQDQARVIRLRDEWVAFDPRHWNADMDCSVNTGLGAGTRERDLAVMQMVMGTQEKLLAAFGPDNPFVKPENVYQTLSKLVESAGLKTPSLYFTEPDEAEVQQKLEAMRNQKSPDQMKVEAQMQIEAMKAKTAQAKEQAQMEADLIVRNKEIEATTQQQAEKLAADAALQRERLAFDMAKWEDEKALRREEMQQKREDEVMKAQAAAIGPQLVRNEANG